MDIVVADNEEKLARCMEYLKKKNVAFLEYTLYFYVEIDGEIKALAGHNYNFGATIEPFVTEGNAYSKYLYAGMQMFFYAKGYKIMNVITKSPAVIDTVKKLGFVEYPNIEYFYTKII